MVHVVVAGTNPHNRTKPEGEVPGHNHEAPRTLPTCVATGWVPVVVAASVLVGGAVLWLGLDLDRDGLVSFQEFGKSNPVRGDSDGDTLADGWEIRHGLNPRNADTNNDGLDDAEELARGANPFSADSDGDGIGDADEPLVDCDNDGIMAVADGDDDNDGRVDGLEPESQRCQADSDFDGVLDGYEGNLACTTRPDCDGDGLPDAIEVDSSFSPLDADTFDVGLPDSVSYAFERAGQAPSQDLDGDGIPDGWEGSDGLIAWGALAPAPGQRDMLIEYLRVQGPDSGRYAYLDFTPAYVAVANAFAAEENIKVSWVETDVFLASEQVPPLVPDGAEPYYDTVLSAGAHSGNPYVTSVILNPQHDQSEVLHSGIAPLRGMFASVDYGTHVLLNFHNDDIGTLSIQPVLESLILGHPNDLLTLLANAEYDDGGVRQDGSVFVHRVPRDGSTPYTVEWTPYWFRLLPVVTFDGNASYTMARGPASVDTPDLAHTILHELGHTLGLCHTHEPECHEAYPLAQRVRQADSTMSYENPPGSALHFLAAEWSVVAKYLTCPPPDPLAAVADAAGRDAVLAAKYNFDAAAETSDVRVCGELGSLPPQYEPNDPAPQQFVTPDAWLDPALASRSIVATAAYAGAMCLAALGAGLWLWRRGSRGPSPITTAV